MAKIYNSDLTKEVIAGAKIQTSHDDVPQELGKTVVPVMEVNPKMLQKITVVGRASYTSSGTSTAWTTPTDKDFFLSTIRVDLLKDVTSDNELIYVTAVINGETVRLLQVDTLPTVIVNGISNEQAYAGGVKLDRGSELKMSGSYTAGAMTKTLFWTGFTEAI